MVGSSRGGLKLMVTVAWYWTEVSALPSRPRLSSRHSMRQLSPAIGSTDWTSTDIVSFLARSKGSLARM